MAADSKSPLRRRASRIAAKLRDAVPGLDGVCLFGSVARGDAVRSSDIDLLIFTGDPALGPVAVLKLLPESLRAQVSIVCCPVDAFYTRYRRRPDFISHIRQESDLLYDRDGSVREMLTRQYSPDGFREGVASCLRQLNLYRDTAPYRSNYLFCLADLYSIGRGLVSLALASDGTPEFNRARAFDRFAAAYPALRRELRSVSSLEPFHALVNGRNPAALPFSYRRGAPAVRRAVAAIEKVAQVITAP